MLRNHLKIAFRQLLRNKVYSAINPFGLSVAIAAGLLIAFFVRNELSYDRHYRDADLIYRVAVDIRTKGGNRVFAALVIALLTVSFQAIRAATANPVKSLRTE